MQWGRWGIGTLDRQLGLMSPRPAVLLGFNEPTHIGQVRFWPVFVEPKSDSTGGTHERCRWTPVCEVLSVRSCQLPAPEPSHWSATGKHDAPAGCNHVAVSRGRSREVRPAPRLALRRRLWCLVGAAAVTLQPCQHNVSDVVCSPAVVRVSMFGGHTCAMMYTGAPTATLSIGGKISSEIAAPCTRPAAAWTSWPCTCALVQSHWHAGCCRHNHIRC